MPGAIPFHVTLRQHVLLVVPVTGFNHYNLRSDRSTLDALRDFYVDIVGLQEGFRPSFKSFGYWLCAGTQAVLHLTGARPGESRPSNVTNTSDQVAFSCMDARERHLTDANVAFTREYVPLTGRVQIFFNDLCGNGVELNLAEAG
ncbi:Diguanylate cyclase [Burkholderia cepacia]